jgi:hypothetical protein
MMSIAKNLVHLAENEGKQVALEEAQKIQNALHSLKAAGSGEEIKAVTFLLSNINCGIDEIIEGTLLLNDE